MTREPSSRVRPSAVHLHHVADGTGVSFTSTTVHLAGGGGIEYSPSVNGEGRTKLLVTVTDFRFCHRHAVCSCVALLNNERS